MLMHHAKLVWASPHDPLLAYSQRNLSKTRDGGVTWDKPSILQETTQSQYRALDVEYDPFNTDTVYAGTRQGVLKTTDSGDTWKLIDMVLEGIKREVWRIVADPATRGRLFAGLSPPGIAISEDHGETWELWGRTDQLAGKFVFGLEIDIAGPSRLYVAVHSGGLLIVDENGAQVIVEQLFAPSPQGSTQGFALSSDGSRLYILTAIKKPGTVLGGRERHELWLYHERSGTLRHLETPELPYSIAPHPYDPMTLYLGTDNGIYVTKDGGESWSMQGDALVDNYLTTVHVDPKNPSTIFVGSRCSTGLSVSVDGGASWDWKRGGLNPWRPGLFGEHYLMQIASSNGNMAYATTIAGLLRSADGGETWDLMVNEFSGRSDRQDVDHLHGLAIDPGNPNVVYMGTGRGGWGKDIRDAFTGSMIWKSSDSGTTWKEAAVGFPIGADTVIQQILVDPNDSDLVYVATNSEDYTAGGKGKQRGVAVGLHKSTDGGETWFPINSGLTDLNVHSLALERVNSEKIYVATNDGLFKSVDGGANWNLVKDGRTLAVATHPRLEGVVFAGTISEGPFSMALSMDGGATWLDAGLPVTPRPRSYADYEIGYGGVYQLMFDSEGRYLYAATSGEGLWRADLSELLRSTPGVGPIMSGTLLAFKTVAEPFGLVQDKLHERPEWQGGSSAR